MKILAKTMLPEHNLCNIYIYIYVNVNFAVFLKSNLLFKSVYYLSCLKNILERLWMQKWQCLFDQMFFMFFCYKIYMNMLLMSGSHARENFFQIRHFSSFLWKNPSICLVGVLKWKWSDFKSLNFVFLEKQADLHQAVTFHINEYLQYECICYLKNIISAINNYLKVLLK